MVLHFLTFFFLADGLEESHHMTVRQAAGRNNRVTDTFSTPSQQELERTGSPVSFLRVSIHYCLAAFYLPFFLNDCHVCIFCGCSDPTPTNASTWKTSTGLFSLNADQQV